MSSINKHNHNDLFSSKATINSSCLADTVEHFDQLNLREYLLRGINDYGLKKPSAVQQRALKPCILGKNVIVQHESDTSRTITYIITILQQLDMNCKDCQALILVPTRELAQAIHGLVTGLGKYMNVTCHACIGNTKVREDMLCLETDFQVVVGTPGRIYDMFRKSAVYGENIKIFILDEADELLSRGFKDQIIDILNRIPSHTQIMLLSTKMSSDLFNISRKFMIEPVEIFFRTEDRTLEGIRQFYVSVEREEWKLPTLCDLCKELPITQAIIFCNRKDNVDLLAETLRVEHFTVSTMQDGMDQDQQDTRMKEFRTGFSRIMVTTDLPGVDIGIAQVSVIINYDLPHEPEAYLHRVGRCGKFGRRGVSISLITNDDRHTLRDIERLYKTQIEEMPEDITNLI